MAIEVMSRDNLSRRDRAKAIDKRAGKAYNYMAVSKPQIEGLTDGGETDTF